MTRGIGRKVAMSGPRFGTKFSAKVMRPNTWAICTPNSHSITATTVPTNTPIYSRENHDTSMTGRNVLSQ